MCAPSNRYADLSLTEERLVKDGDHVLVAYTMKPKAGYDYLTTAAHFAAVSSTGTNVGVCTTEARLSAARTLALLRASVSSGPSGPLVRRFTPLLSPRPPGLVALVRCSPLLPPRLACIARLSRPLACLGLQSSPRPATSSRDAACCTLPSSGLSGTSCLCRDCLDSVPPFLSFPAPTTTTTTPTSALSWPSEC